MVLDDDLRDLIMNNAPTDELRNMAKAKGMTLLRDAGIDFVLSGTTTAEEVIRETITDA